MRATLLIALLTLAGCNDVASCPPPPTEVRTVVVNTPVATPCLNASDIPAMPAQVGSMLNGDSVHDLDVLAAADLRLRTALDKSLSLLGACVK